MRRNFRFYRVPETGRWYVDLPEWEGEVADLEMVMGADTFLDILAQGEDQVFVTLSVVPEEGDDKLVLIEPGKLEGPEMGEGAWYKLESYRGIEYGLSMWLCDVTTFVFGYFPKEIYFA